MATVDNSDIISLIGIQPFSQRTFDEQELLRKLRETPTLTSMVKLFLTRHGLPERTLRSALPNSLVSAYVNQAYLVSWRNRVNPSFARSSSLMDDDDDGLLDKAATKLTVSVPLYGEKTSLSSPPTEEWLKTLFSQINATVTKLVKTQLDNSSLKLDEAAKDQIRALVKFQANLTAKEAAEETVTRLMPPREVLIRSGEFGTTTVNVGLQHEKFETLLKACSARDHRGYHLNVWLTGPTASGKTTAAESVAKAMSLPFGSDGSLDSDYKVLGFIDANGNIVSTQFLKIYENGGIYLADEIDNWQASALLSLNAALANGWVASPKGMTPRHKDCVVIAAANTWGLGATSEYVGRSKLDAASLDRFQPKILWPYDTNLERALAVNQAGKAGSIWFDIVVAYRSAVAKQGLKIIISPRATFSGLALLASGFTPEEVIEMTLVASLAPEQVRAVTNLANVLHLKMLLVETLETAKNRKAVVEEVPVKDLFVFKDQDEDAILAALRASEEDEDNADTSDDYEELDALSEDLLDD
jgi:cobaltochelatase CobS